MTLEELIAEVCEDLDRLDLLPVARKNARHVLFSCHGMANFHKDVAQTANIPVSAELVSTALPANFRKMYGIVSFADTGEEVAVEYTQKGAKPFVDYYGFVNSVPTYNLHGGQLFVQFPQGAIMPTNIALRYFSYPTFVVATDATVSSDSFMLAHNGDYIKAKLLEKLCAISGNTAMYAVAQADAQAALYRLLTSELHTLPQG